jgi:ElaB/YqjD/DUF883 family membrane-anchored ribosome-binding protein
MEASSNTVERRAKEAHDAVDAAAARARERAAPAIDRVAHAAHQTVDGVAQAADGAVGWVGQSAEQWRVRQEQALEACRSSVRERPMVAIGIALAAGFIVGRWLVR